MNAFNEKPALPAHTMYIERLRERISHAESEGNYRRARGLSRMLLYRQKAARGTGSELALKAYEAAKAYKWAAVGPTDGLGHLGAPGCELVCSKSEYAFFCSSDEGIAAFAHDTACTVYAVENGFCFLGFLISPYGISPSKESVKAAKARISKAVKSSHGKGSKALVRSLNSLIEDISGSWAPVSSRKALHSMDYYIQQSLRRFFKREHPKKSQKWIRSKYWASGNFADPASGETLAKMARRFG
ncbi:MAG: hypothetical protein FWG30_03690 [Eubacteriaceae bacterium]|nr:hypothetical protein [Eubacteriaceae bacterium]